MVKSVSIRNLVHKVLTTWELENACDTVDPELDLGFIEPKLYIIWHTLFKKNNINTFTNFTQACEHVNTLLMCVSEPWKEPMQMKALELQLY